MNALAVSLFIINQAMVCVPQGPYYSDGDLQTFTEVKCIEVPFSDKSLQCLEDEFVELQEVYPNE